MAWQSVRRFVVAVSAAVAVGATTLAGPPLAVAADPVVQITITGVTPPVGQVGAPIQVSGTVVNVGSTDLSGATVRLWYAPTPINSLDDFDAAVTAPPSEETAVLADSVAMLVADGPLYVGDTATFAVTGTPPLEEGGSAYVMGVDVVSSRDVVLGQARVVYGIASGSTKAALLVLLSTRPSMLTPGAVPGQALFADDHVAAELDGRLGALLTLAERPGATPLIDPALVDDLTAMAAGYLVMDADGGRQPGVGQAAAQAALTRITQLTSKGAYRTLAGSPDLDAMAALPQAASMAGMAVTLPPDSPLASLPLAVVASASTPAAQALIAGVQPSLVISEALVPTRTLQAVGGTQWVAPTPVAALTGVQGPQQTPGGNQTVQGVIGPLARFVLAQANAAPVVMLVDDPGEAASASAWLDAGWLPVALSAMTSEMTASAPVWLPDPPMPATPPPELASTIEHVRDQLALWSDLGDTTTPGAATARLLVPGALSSLWGADWAATEAWLTPAAALVDLRLGGGAVELRAASQWRLSSDNNTVPVTIVNSLGIAVRVSVHCVSQNPQRLSVPDSAPVTVQSGTATTVVLTPIASGNGSVDVTCQIASVRGTPVGAPISTQVVTTNAGRLGWIIIIGSGIAFVVATTLRVRQVRRQRRDRAQ